MNLSFLVAAQTRALRVRNKLLRTICEPIGVGRFSKMALNNLDDKLQAYLKSSPGYFVEAGANDGVTQSNTYFLEKVRGWKGVLVEPIPELYSKCVVNRRRSKVYNRALVSTGNEKKPITMHYANLMSCVDGALKSKTAQERHLTVGLEVQGIQSSYSVEIQAATITDILADAGAPREFDLLSLDVEGYESEVLKGLNFERYRPRYLLIEARFFDDVQSVLAGRYRLVERLSAMDCLFESTSTESY
jgi:FkbM family methyltransferase